MDAQDILTVETPAGPIRGRQKESVWLFAGIPYAAPPLELLRFRAPQAHAPFTTPYDAFKFGPAAPQVPSGGMTDSAPVRWNEDCLTLNISTPGCDSGKRAVLVWIHGGAYRSGQGAIPWYNGSRFSRDGDIVVVSINYRLGALGFLDLSHLGEEFATSSCNGTLDQIAALQWVQDNISAFGGDPGRVTIAGESAGAFSVTTLLSAPGAQGLFSQVIAQSGGGHHTQPPQASAEVTAKFQELSGWQDAISLQAAGVEDILKHQNAVIDAFETGAAPINRLGTTVPPFYPAHGNEVLPQAPIEALRSGTGSNVALLTGSNTDETSLWGHGRVDQEKLTRFAQAYGNPALVDTYQQTRPEASPNELLIALTSDHMFRIPAIRTAEVRAAHTTSTWVYQFNWKSRAFDGRLGATHALEIPFAFNNLDRAGVDAFIGPGPVPQNVADDMHSAWTQFINDGQPGWPEYNLDQRATQVFDEHSELLEDPAAEERAAWNDIR